MHVVSEEEADEACQVLRESIHRLPARQEEVVNSTSSMRNRFSEQITQ